MATASRILSALGRMLRPRPPRSASAPSASPDAGRAGATATAAVVPPGSSGLVLSYAPDRDGNPDAGEIVWTWVPYEENDGRGKDRPVLVVARQSSDRVYAVRLTSKPHDRDRDYVPLGAGEWDASGRESWVDIEQLYSVHAGGMRREAAALDPARFARVAEALTARYGWERPR